MMNSLISVLHDPIWVWRFQSFFGVEKVQKMGGEIDPQIDWDIVEVDANSKKLKVVDKKFQSLQRRNRNLLLYKVFMKRNQRKMKRGILHTGTQ